MLKYGYNKSLACGSICAAGTLGQIIPPSIILIILGDVLGLPVGDLFQAALIPGLALVGVYVIYVLLFALARPDAAPLIPFEDAKASRLRHYVDALRTIEGLRAYAAAHEGRWPEKLQDVQQTPIPLDPITGQPFPFEVREGRGELLLSPQPDIRNLPGRRYQIEFQAP